MDFGQRRVFAAPEAAQTQDCSAKQRQPGLTVWFEHGEKEVKNRTGAHPQELWFQTSRAGGCNVTRVVIKRITSVEEQMKRFNPMSHLAAGVFLFAAAAACNAQQPEKKAETPVEHSTMTPEQHAAMHGGTSDSSFREMQKRGQMAMGVNQYTSTHKFEITRDGGRIELQRNTFDSLDVAQIRAHMKMIQHAFEAGDFSTPAFVHMRSMPGTATMAKNKALIHYAYGELPRGAEVRISTGDAESRAAIAEFLEAQRAEHRASGK
jgi:hypothetical protein